MEDVSHYEEYLGSIEEQKKCQQAKQEDSRVHKRGKGPPSTVICNHTGWLEGFALTKENTCFSGKEEAQRIPIFGTLLNALNTLYMPRGGSQEARDNTIQTIIRRQKDVEVDSIQFSPLVVFAEGTTTIGSCLMPFKRGGFVGMRTVIPSFVTFNNGQINPFYDCVQVLPLMAMLFSSLEPCICTFTKLPEFTPNTIMLDKLHSDKGKEPWEIFAWCIRDVMSKHSGLPKDDKSSYREKVEYCKFMHGRTSSLEVDGETYHYEDSKNAQKSKLS